MINCFRKNHGCPSRICSKYSVIAHADYLGCMIFSSKQYKAASDFHLE
ncbi:hypothetical protein V6Z11_A07G119000 [Gossypium hirsutum]